LLILIGYLTQAGPLGTAFTYQGRLTDGTKPAGGSYDFRFTIYDSGGHPLAAPLTNTAVPVIDGLFATTLDFGANVFTGDARGLEIAVRTNSSVAGFQVLAPLQPVAPVPYAIFAPNAGAASVAITANRVANNAVSGAGIANGQVVRCINGLQDAVVLAAGANVALATNGNTVQISAATNATGSALASYRESGLFAVPPVASGPNAIAQGEHAQALGDHSVVGGGLDNLAGLWYTTVSGGWSNSAAGLLFGRTTIGGGEMNQAIGDWATVGGGQLNIAGGSLWGRATVAGGWQNTALGDMSTIGGGSQNSAVIGHAVICGGQANVVSNGAYAAIGGGSQNSALGGHGVISGGQSNTITTLQAPWSVIGGGHVNQISGMAGTIGGGFQNSVGAQGGTVGGGEANIAAALYTAVGGGNGNSANGYASTVAGGIGNLASKGARHKSEHERRRTAPKTARGIPVPPQ